MTQQENDGAAPKERLAIFFDGTNHYQALYNLDMRLNYGDFVKHMAKKHNLISARYYLGLNALNESIPIKSFLGDISKVGIVPHTRLVYPLPNGKLKNNKMDVEIAVDAIQLSPYIDRFMLFSGDGNFTYLLKELQRVGVYTIVYASKSEISSELESQTNEFKSLESLTRHFSYKD